MKNNFSGVLWVHKITESQTYRVPQADSPRADCPRLCSDDSLMSPKLATSQLLWATSDSSWWCSMFRKTLLYFNLWPLPLIPPLDATEKSLSPSSLHHPFKQKIEFGNTYGSLHLFWEFLPANNPQMCLLVWASLGGEFYVPYIHHHRHLLPIHVWSVKGYHILLQERSPLWQKYLKSWKKLHHHIRRKIVENSVI